MLVLIAGVVTWTQTYALGGDEGLLHLCVDADGSVRFVNPGEACEQGETEEHQSEVVTCVTTWVDEKGKKAKKAKHPLDEDGEFRLVPDATHCEDYEVPVAVSLAGHEHDDRYYTKVELSGEGLSRVHWANLINVPADIADGDDDTLAFLDCQAGQIAKWDGDLWACAPDEDNAEAVTALQAKTTANMEAIANVQATTTANLEAIANVQAKTTANMEAIANVQATTTANAAAISSLDVSALQARVAVLEGALGRLNESPVVDAGPDKQALIGDCATLGGSATDDGILLPLVAEWTKVSGPGTPSFSPGSDTIGTSPTSAVCVTVPGTYVFKLTASDGLAEPFDTMTLTFFPDNDPPVVTVPTPSFTQTGQLRTQNISEFLSCTFSGLGVTATDDGIPNATLSTNWSRVSHSRRFSTALFFTSFSNPTSVNTAVTIEMSRRVSRGGVGPGNFNNVVRLTAFDGFFTRTGDVTLHCNRP